MFTDDYGNSVRRLLAEKGVPAESQPTVADVVQFQAANGDPVAGAERQYGAALGKFLEQRGHKVNYINLD